MTDDWLQRKDLLESELARAQSERSALERRLAALLDAIRQLESAQDEEQLATLALHLPARTVPLAGVALLRFGARVQPEPLACNGGVDQAALTAWHAQLSSSLTRARCETCRLRTGRESLVPGLTCSLFQRLPLPNVESVVCLPLQREEHEFGVLGLFVDADRPLASEDYPLLEGLAAALSGAFENWRLREQEIAPFYSMTDALTRRLNLDQILVHLLSHAMQAAGADAAALLLAGPKPSGEPAEPQDLYVSAAVGEWAGVKRLPALAKAAAGLLALPDARVLDLCGDDPGMGSVLLSPAITAEGPLGVLALGASRCYAFQRSHLRIAGAFAAQVALAAQNAALYARLDELAGASLEHGASLARQLRDVVVSFARRSGLAFDLHIAEDPPVSAPVLRHLMRIVQEALDNIAQHARAESVHLSLTRAGRRYRLLITDDGVGFDGGRDPALPGRGLRTIRARADLLGADVQVESAPGTGTRVLLEWSAPAP